MNFWRYLKDKYQICLIWFVGYIFMYIFLMQVGTSSYACGYLMAFLFLLCSVSFIIDYFRKKRFYDELKKNLTNLDKRYLLSEMIEEPSFLEGKILYDTLQDTCKSMNDELAEYKSSVREYREYIEMWIHEVKTPIASIQLLLSNNQSELTNDIEDEVIKVERYLEQVLYYARSNNVDKDYLIREISLDKVVKSAIKKNAKDLIRHKIGVDIGEISGSIYADVKWLEFILNQIINNAIKYSAEGTKLHFTTEMMKHQVRLYIRDEGVGISANDLPRVTEKGYTGETGRKYGKSTGMGLYLCEKLCSKMGLVFKITSVVGEGTTVMIGFPEYKLL